MSSLPFSHLIFLLLLLILVIFHPNLSSSLYSSTSSLINNKPRCHPDESSALLKLTVLKILWTPQTDCCTWYGITCDNSTGHVIDVKFFIGTLPSLSPNSSLFYLSRLRSLDLSNKGLAIDAPTFEALARSLVHVTRLDLSGNDMSAVAPASLENLTSSLVSLSLSACHLQGKLPENFFLNFPRLETVDLSINALGGKVPGSLLALDRLASVSLSRNAFRGLIPSSGDRFPSSLKSLVMSDNLISGPIPSRIYLLPHLEELVLRMNSFSGEIGEFLSTSLTDVDLRMNRFRGIIPTSIFRQSKLEKLDLSSNNLTGTLMFGEISRLRELSYLDVSSNHFSSLSFENSSTYSLENSSLVSLDISNNRCKGIVPKWFLEVGKDSLQNLNLSHNSLTHIDSIPWKNLVALDLSSNLFSGDLPFLPSSLQSFSASRFSKNIPSSFCDLKFLFALDLSYNKISGEIPKCLGNLSPLLLDLKDNEIRGAFPAKEMPTLQYLDLRSNMFSGPLPIISYNLSIFLFMSNNRSSGGIPALICNLRSLVMLDLSNNRFSGEIPRCIGNFSTYLAVLNLRGNHFRGAIPMEFPKGNVLTSLNLNGNQLEGVVTRSLENCKNLETLDLGNNALNDTFPQWLKSLPALQVLVLRSNKFHGSIVGNPNLRKLRIMDLSHNVFSGDLPKEYFRNFRAMQIGARNAKMGYMGKEYYQESVMVTMKGSYMQLERIQTILATVDLSNNDFSGNIPESIGRLRSLKGLHLAANNLTGTIPSSSGNLTDLEWLDLSANDLIGHIPAELVHIPWLSFLNLSHNRLEGPIPRGSQFNTFGNESFAGNFDLCGFPLTKTCGGSDAEPSPWNVDRDSRTEKEFGYWKIATMGYASGLVIGMSIGYVLLYSNGKLSWLSDVIFEILLRFKIGPKTRPMRLRSSRGLQRQD